MIELDQNADLYSAKLKVVGVGGGGGNAINSMIARGLEGCEFVAVNTDAQALSKNSAPHKIQVGKELTRGLGAGANPDVGRDASIEDREEIAEVLGEADMVFVTAGMGGGTGTGSAPVVAQTAREMGALVVGIVTRPFNWEGRPRQAKADSGIEELRKHVDTLIVVPNQRLLSIIDKNTSLQDAFRKVDDVLYNATSGIARIITGQGYINVDFADVRTIMHEMGEALMGTGTASGEDRAVEAAQNAISSPLLEGISIEGSQGVLINIAASSSLTMMEIDEAVEIVYNSVGQDANIIFGVVMDEELEEKMMVTVIATGFNKNEAARRQGATESKSAPFRTVGYDIPNRQEPLENRPQETPDPDQETPAPRIRETREYRPSDHQKLDEPAYVRRQNAASSSSHNVQRGGFDLPKQSDQTDSSQQTESNKAEQNQQDHDAQEKPRAERAAFLRRIMD